MFKQKLIAILGCLIILTTILAVSPVSAAPAQMTYEDLKNMDEADIDSLTLNQIEEITDSFSKLTKEELGKIDKDTHLKIYQLWQRYYLAEAETSMQKSIANTNNKRSLLLDSPGLRSDTVFTSANWGDSGGGGTMWHDWTSSYVLASNRNNLWAEGDIEGYAYAFARNGVAFSTSPWAANEVHEVDITIDGYLGWWMTTMGFPGEGSFEVILYLYDATNQQVVNNITVYDQGASLLFNQSGNYSDGFRATLHADRDYVVFVRSYITAFAFILVDPGYCQSDSDVTDYHTDWSAITLSWVN
jgi:hypothetical protein